LSLSTSFVGRFFLHVSNTDSANKMSNFENVQERHSPITTTSPGGMPARESWVRQNGVGSVAEKAEGARGVESVGKCPTDAEPPFID